MRYKDRTIRSVAQMLSALKQQAKPKQHIWFRGQGRKSWPLVPGLARAPKNLKAENALIKRFMQNAMPLIDRPPMEEWEWMFLMQHHRAPTRLLDWSESPLAALYFAVQEEENMRAVGAVWCLDAVALNRAANLKFEFASEIRRSGLTKCSKVTFPAMSQKVRQSHLRLPLLGRGTRRAWQLN